ncbi:MAG: 1-acyl-sn-glycerol-3-phosphate acyltransferase, partial [Acholeplasmatales bacterium]|nr:1-acyl-sn-glycerol-3-phosphate acyltransferase [Acholeplasmatales bacterium]
MAKEVKKRHKFLYKVCMLIAKKRFLKRYGLPDEPFDVKDKQVFIIGNHTTSMDGALLDIYFRRPIFLVTTEFTMSQGFKSWIFRYVFNPIPFAKGTSDMSSMKRLLTVVKEGGNIALYPEGNFSYNGLTGYIKPSIAKLVKSAKLPLYIVNTIGTYFENARWMVSKIYGPSKMIIRKVLYYDEYSKMSNEELLNIIRENLQVDHYAYQEKEMNKYVGKDRALGLERAV